MLQRLNIRNSSLTMSQRMISKLAFMCPGQGSQYVGMFQNLDKLDELKDLVTGGEHSINEYLKHVVQVGNTGPQILLNKTINCQPAVVLSSILTFEKLKNKLKDTEIVCVAGYSVGEIAALYIGGYLSLPDVLKVIKARAEAMQNASNLQETGMVTIRGLTYPQASDLCEDLSATTSKDDSISVAIDVYPNCVALGGSAAMLNKVMERSHQLLENEKDIKITPVPVSGAFHTPYMAPAQEEFQRVLESVHWLPSNTCLYSNVTGKPYTVENNKIDLLVRQLCEPVRWSAILDDVSKKVARKEVTKLFEVGPGKQLRTMAGKVDRKMARLTESIDL